ncbi:MAG TPA: ABC transporter permease [Actinoplanes sp.]|nr:ABC transporter permease [Actinoplanes sp.]
MAETAVAESDATTSLRELAARHGLHAAGALPSLSTYTRQLWKYRHFIGSYANARVSSSLGKTRLGRIWQVLTPLTNAAVYYLIFGMVLSQDRKMPNFVVYLCIGVFVFIFSQSSAQAGVTSITANLGLIRALHFPRASLPIAVTLIEAQHLIASMTVLMAICLFFKEPLTWMWLLIPLILLLQTIFNAGLALILARIGSKLTDLKQVMPFALRVWFYGSAVLYPVKMFEDRLDGWLLVLVESNPLLIYIELMRHSLMENAPLANSPLRLWLVGLGWALAFGIGGFVYFWRGEKEYGRG